MSRFYASIQADKGEVTRQGTKRGIMGHIRGWNTGIRVRCYVSDDDKDICEVYLTGGSNNPWKEKLIGVYEEK